MNYEFSPRSSISEEIEEDIVAYNNSSNNIINNTDNHKKSINIHDYEYIPSKIDYTNSDMSSDDDDNFDTDSREPHETSRDKYNRSFSRLDFQNSEELQYNVTHKCYRLSKKQYEELQLFYESNKSLNGLFSVKLLNSLLISNSANI